MILTIEKRKRMVNYIGMTFMLLFIYFYILKDSAWTSLVLRVFASLFIILAMSFIKWKIKWKFIKIVYYTSGRDLISLIRFVKTKLFMYLLKKRNATVPKLFKLLVNKHPDKVVFYYEDQIWTYRQLDDFSNRVANCLLELGFQPGEEIAVFMESKPEFVGIWLGLSKAGMTAALINTSQRLDTLVHSITIVNCKAIIFGSELTQAVKEIISTLNNKYSMKYFCYGQTDYDIPCVKSLKELLNESSTDDPLTINKGNFSDRLFYIYTSGTTGLPKAAIIKHNRYVFFGAALRNMLKIQKDDIMYTSLPLYHQAAGTLGTCQCLIFGTTMAIRRKFSATHFWDDCIRYNCTVAQYIGEICRYLLAQPQKDNDKQHNIRLMFGNGLRPTIWKEFTTRFNIKQIGEFYGSTEGNANVINVDNTQGSCGFVTRIAPFIYPVTLIKVDELTGQPIRDSNSLCVQAQPHETGEFVGKIIDTDPSRSFDGYVSSDATKKKIIYDVFHKGDKAFSSGDLLTMDEFGYLYFKDRTGDTYRWKGENVSTMEIEGIISNQLHLQDCVVYGVHVSGCEGKAGMVAIPRSNNDLDLNQLLIKLQKVLSPYAIPVFVRIVDNLSMTGTFKLPKNQLQNQGYNPSTINDPLYILDSKHNHYVELTESLYEKLIKGEFRI